MLYKNAMLFLPDRGFVPGAFRVENGLFRDVGTPTPTGEEAVDLQGARVLPGLVDIHIHGSFGADFSDGDDEGLLTMSGYLARHGITSFAPASMTLPCDVLARAFAAGRRHADAAPAGHARLLGIHMEGPFFPGKKKGAQNAAYLRAPDFDAFRALWEGCGGLVKIVDAAPPFVPPPSDPPGRREPGTRWALWKTASWRTSLSAGRIFLSGRSISRTARCTGCDHSPGNRIAILPGW